MLFALLLRRVIKKGQLTVTDAHGCLHRFGDPASGPKVAIRLHDPRLHWCLFLNPRLFLGEAYMDGSLTMESGRIYDFLDLVAGNLGIGTAGPLDRWLLRTRMLWRRMHQANSPQRARRNVAHHYDISGALYDLFLDADRQYSCAYFQDPDMDLERAQAAKKRHIAGKLLLKPGQRVLDLGSGWGGLALYLAAEAGVEVAGITLSEEQLVFAQEQAAKRGLANCVGFHLGDYREEAAQYDRVVSVGMFEHVGTPNYNLFFSKLSALLKDDGVALLHTIAHMDEPYPTNPWLQKYIFPGGYAPALSEILPAIERAGLWVTDIEILRLHYAETLRHWRERFSKNREKAAELYDQRFCRMWEFYLAASEVAFRHQGHMVAQIQLAKSQEAVPLTRDYIVEWEATRGLSDETRRPDHVRLA